jgi:hypothetical protein
VKRLIIASICILTLIVAIGYLGATYSVQTPVSAGHEACLLLAAADEDAESSGQKDDEKKDEVPGIDRIACCVCYG